MAIILRTSIRTAFGNKDNLKDQLEKATDPKKIKELNAKIKAGILNDEYYKSKIKELKAGEIVLNGETIKVNWGPDLKNPDGSIMTDYSQSTYKVKIGTLAKIEKGRLLIVRKCEKNWCNIETDEFSGWINKANVWVRNG